MNLTTYNKYPKTIPEINRRIQESINSCTNHGQVMSVLNFHMVYIESVYHFSKIKHRKVTDEVMEEYFAEQKKEL